MNQRLTIGFFLFGCLIVLATVLGFNRIERLQDIVVEQDKTIKIQQEAIMMQRVENTMLKQMVYPRN